VTEISDPPLVARTVFCESEYVCTVQSSARRDLRDTRFVRSFVLSKAVQQKYVRFACMAADSNRLIHSVLCCTE